MAKIMKMPPHLVDVGAEKRCSECRKPFPAESQPSLSRAFREHVQLEHKAPQPPKRDLLQN
jgi:hypothetical protein